MSMNKSNPFAQKSGLPIKGKEVEFFEWEKSKELVRINGLPKEEKQKALAARNLLKKKMDV
jgi:hypothetical protein